MRYRSLIVASVIGLMTATVACAEQARTKLGVLTCTVVNPAKDEGQKMTCGFKPAGTGAEEKYSGNVRGSEQDPAFREGRFGLDGSRASRRQNRSWHSFATIHESQRHIGTGADARRGEEPCDCFAI
jgi:hypothetical protein